MDSQIKEEPKEWMRQIDSNAQPEPKKGFSVILFFVVSLSLVSLFSFLRFYVFKNYDMIIETTCNPEIENCFSRDCSIEDECPPNNLSTYNTYVIKAFQFEKCNAVDGCAHFCENVRNCEKIECGVKEEDVCSTPNIPVE